MIEPKHFQEILEATKKCGFEQLSDVNACSLLSTLVASKQNAKILELGTGTGLATSWILNGMDNTSVLQTVDNDSNLVNIAKQYLSNDKRVEFFVENGEDLILRTEKNSVDFIFADTWPGKYNHLEETLDLLKSGGIYLIDDMLPQDNWPDGHSLKVDKLINYLENREDLHCTRLDWSTGIIICTKS